MSEYTSGPWFVRNWGDETDEWPQKRVSISNSKEALFINAIFANNVEANARLIAAAPELLEAISDLCDMWSSVCSSNGWEPDHLTQYENAIKAIAKARGEE